MKTERLLELYGIGPGMITGLPRMKAGNEHTWLCVVEAERQYQQAIDQRNRATDREINETR